MHVSLAPPPEMSLTSKRLRPVGRAPRTPPPHSYPELLLAAASYPIVFFLRRFLGHRSGGGRPWWEENEKTECKINESAVGKA